MTAFIDFTGHMAPVPIDPVLQLTSFIPSYENQLIAQGGGPAVNRSGLTTTLVRTAFFDGATIGANPPLIYGTLPALTVTDPLSHSGVNNVSGTALNQLSDLNSKAAIKDA
jgi:hypothetical protein